MTPPGTRKGSWRFAAGVIGLAALCLGPLTAARAEVSIGIGINLPGLRIGINVPSMPQLVAVPGYPVYYAPQLSANYFFYDGLYWVYARDNWYASTWYDGPWGWIDPDRVPLFVLRVPVRYYRAPPAGFRSWGRDGAPHWGERWGHDWQQRHRDWDRWDHRSRPAPAALPMYQRSYAGDRYPRGADQQRAIRDREDHGGRDDRNDRGDRGHRGDRPGRHEMTPRAMPAPTQRHPQAQNPSERRSADRRDSADARPDRGPQRGESRGRGADGRQGREGRDDSDDRRGDRRH